MQTEFTALQQTALSPACHLPADPADPKSRALAAADTAAYRERLAQSGKVQLAVWIPGELRERIDVAAGSNGRSLSSETTALIQEGFEYRELAK